MGKTFDIVISSNCIVIKIFKSSKINAYLNEKPKSTNILSFLGSLGLWIYFNDTVSLFECFCQHFLLATSSSSITVWVFCYWWEGFWLWLIGSLQNGCFWTSGTYLFSGDQKILLPVCWNFIMIKKKRLQKYGSERLCMNL